MTVLQNRMKNNNNKQKYVMKEVFMMQIIQLLMIQMNQASVF